MIQKTDEQIIINYLNGDENSLEILVKRYIKPIYSFTYRYVGDYQEAEDITQEVFIKVWRNIKKFDKNKSFKTWIFRIAKNTSIDFLKKKKSIPFSEFENEEGENILIEKLADPVSLPGGFIEKIGIAEILDTAMNQLSPKYRMVLFLHYNDHLTFREIAEIFEEPLHTVKSRHRRALIKLKGLLR